jgi:hypothetical protein
MTNIAEEALTWSIHHLLKHGDTDIFPYPLEFGFFADYHVQITKFLAGLDISNYRSMSALESLVPKSRYNFRVAHQLYPTDTILFTAAVHSIGADLESSRLSVGDGPFSYRYSPNHDFDLFAEHCRYGDWLKAQYWRICPEAIPISRWHPMQRYIPAKGAGFPGAWSLSNAASEDYVRYFTSL